MKVESNNNHEEKNLIMKSDSSLLTDNIDHSEIKTPSKFLSDQNINHSSTHLIEEKTYDVIKMMNSLENADNCLEDANSFINKTLDTVKKVQNYTNNHLESRYQLNFELLEIYNKFNEISHIIFSLKNRRSISSPLKSDLILDKLRNCELKLNEKIMLMDSQEEENKCIKEQIVLLKEAIHVKDAEIARISEQFLDLDKKQKVSGELKNDLSRLRSHLMETEERYTVQIKELEEEKRKAEIMVQTMSIELNRTKTNLSEARVKYERHIKLLNEQLGHTSAERDEYVAQVVQLSDKVESQKILIESLNETLSENQKDFDSQLALILDSHSESISQVEKKIIEEKFKEIDQLRSQLNSKNQAILNDIQNELNKATNDNNNLKLTIEELELKLKFFESCEDKNERASDRLLLKNLLIAYTKLHDEHKPFAWRVICDVIGITSDEIQNIPKPRSTLAWIPIINRFVSSTEPNISNDRPSLSQMFVDYLEEESKKISVLNPSVPPISTDELVDLVSRHKNSNL